jgi:Domain of unknown function (DUF1844)
MSKDHDEQPSRGFKVEDRRRFVDDAAEAPREESAPEPSPTVTFEAATDPTPPPVHDEAHPHQEINFSTFVMGLSTQALMHLGEIADPEAPEGPDLPAAKHMIDLLGILREKTTGNLEPAEEQLLSSMLYDLRMRYVEVSRKR